MEREIYAKQVMAVLVHDAARLASGHTPADRRGRTHARLAFKFPLSTMNLNIAADQRARAVRVGRCLYAEGVSHAWLAAIVHIHSKGFCSRPGSADDLGCAGEGGMGVRTATAAGDK